MKKSLPAFVISIGLVCSLTACANARPGTNEAPETPAAAVVQAPAEDDGPASPSEASEPAENTGRQDGERFEAVIVIEGMEETVRYEHVRNDALGFEMDYEYESFTRYRDPVCDRFVSIYDDPEDPQNYLELSCSAADAETVAASVCATLSDDYDVLQESCTLENAGSCLRIDATHARHACSPLEMVYIIPAADGCRIAMAHYSFESAEGFGKRFSCMTDTLEVIARDPDAADFVEVPEEDLSGWTGADFGELPPEDFFTGVDYGELPPEDFGG